MINVTHFMRKPGASAYSIERLFEDVRTHLPPDIHVSVCTSRFISKGLFRRLYDILRVPFYQNDVNHITGDVHFLTYLLDRRRTVLTIHDCVLLEHSHGIRRKLIWLFWYWLPEKRCAAITAISEVTRQQVLHHLRCDPDKVCVIYDNVSDEFKPTPQPFNVSKPRILHVGTPANKNLDRHVAALEGLDCELVIIGKLSSMQVDILKQYHISYENYVGLSRQALVKEYCRCDMLLFASTYEGFGLPIIEANAVGRPIVTSNIWSMPEVAGDSACLVDPFSVDNIRDGIIRVIGDSAYRELLVENGFKNVKRFHSETIAAEYASLYRLIHARLNKHCEEKV